MYEMIHSIELIYNIELNCTVKKELGSRVDCTSTIELKLSESQ